MDTTAQHATAIPEITSSFTTNVLAPPPFFNPLLPQETPTALDTTTSLPALPDFASVFKFNEKVTSLEKDLSEIKQVNQYAQALSSIPAIVDCYMDNKLREAINKAILAHNLYCRQEAQDEKNAYIELVDTSMRALIKEEVNTQLPQILPQAVSNFANLVIDKNVIESVEVAVLTRGVEMKKTKIETPPLDQTEGQKEGNRVKMLSPPEIQEEPSHTVEDSGMQQDQEFVMGDNDEQPADKEVTKADCQVAYAEEPPTSFDELNDTSFDFFAFDYFINKDLEYLNGGDLRRYSTSVTKSKVATYELKWIEDLVPEFYLEEIEVRRDDHKLYTFKEGDFKRLRLQDIEDKLLLLVQQKLTNLTIDERYDLNVALHQFKRKRLMRVDELHKLSDGTLKDVRTALHDIVTEIRMEYLPMRKWSNLNKKRAQVMVQDID
ncbi:hypothetical protein Tco_0612756 [Tanacetum coccineum]